MVTSQETISLATAANQFGTNIRVIQRWISLGFIQACSDCTETRILREPFAVQVEAMRNWLQEFYTDDDGILGASVEEMDDFWLSLPENSSKCTAELCPRFGKAMPITWERWGHKEYVCPGCGYSAMIYAEPKPRVL